MDIADDVERAVLASFVVIQWHMFDGGRFHFLRSFQHEDVAESFFAEAAQGAPQLRVLLADHVRAEVALVTQPIALLTELFRHVQNNGDREAVVLPGEGDERLARFRLHIGCVDDCQAAQSQPLRRDKVQDLEGVLRHPLVVLLVTYQRAAGVRRQNLGRQEMLARKRALA